MINLNSKLSWEEINSKPIKIVKEERPAGEERLNLVGIYESPIGEIRGEELSKFLEKNRR